MPARFGESVVLRVLDKSVVNLDPEALSLPDDIMQTIRDIVARPNGIFIVTARSGKTTTLYSALGEVNDVETKILTAEDPVEYEIEGIMQVAVNHQVGLDFSRALRAFLRQDPDKIMVGEIRDLETAQIAVQASLTGHVVLSTLHTNDASGAVTRLIDMGFEPLDFGIFGGALAQRLSVGFVPAVGLHTSRASKLSTRSTWTRWKLQIKTFTMVRAVLTVVKRLPRPCRFIRDDYCDRFDS